MHDVTTEPTTRPYGVSLRTVVRRTDGRERITVSTIPAAYDHGGPETALLGDTVDTLEAVTRHDDDLETHHRAGIDRARAILGG